MAEPVPVAVVGAGYFGRLHAGQYAANPAARLVAIVDIDEAKARAAALEFGAAPVGDYRSIIGRVAAASVAVPTPQHFEVAHDLINGGIHVLVEKPITDSVISDQQQVADTFFALGLLPKQIKSSDAARRPGT